MDGESIFQWKISLGTVVHLIGIIIAVLGAYWRLRENFTSLVQETRDEVMRMHNEVVTKVAVIESRVNDMWASWKNGN